MKNSDPLGANTQDRQTGGVSNAITLVALGTYLVLGVVGIFFHDWKMVYAVTCGSILFAAPLWLFRTGHLRAGNLALMTIVLATVTFIATVGQGIHDIALVGFPVVFIYVALTSDRIMLTICGAMAFLSLLWLGFGGSLGWFTPVPLFDDPHNLFYIVTMTVLLVVTALAIDLLSANLRRSLERARHEIAEREKAEQALKESNELFSQFLLHSPVYAFFKHVTPSESRVLQASENFGDMIGIRGHQMVGKTMEELFPAELAAKMTADDWAVVSGGRVMELDEELDGRRYATVKFPIAGRNGKYLAGFTMDVTERSLTEHALRESEQRFRSLFEHHAAIMLVVDPLTGCIVDANESAARFYGWTIEELRQMSVGQINCAPPRAVQEAIEKSASSAQATFETRHRRADGSTREVEVFSSRIETAGKTVLYSIIHDITERRMAEGQIGLLKHSIDVALDPAYWMSPEGRFIYVNDAACRAIGYSREELLSMGTLDINPGATAGTWAGMWDALKASGTLTAESVHRRKDGSEFPVRVSFVYFRHGEEEYCNGYAFDLTESRRLQEEQEKLQAQLQQAQKMESVGRIAGGVAHDFNNMLGVILGHADLALEQVGPSHPLFEHLAEIRTSAMRSADLTRQLLSFARKQAISPKVVNLNGAVEGMLRMLQRLIGEDVVIRWEPQAEPWNVKVDPSQLDQVLTNLCVNARDAIAGVGHIAIQTRNAAIDTAYCAENPGAVPGDYVLLCVRDDGRGMGPETLSHVFEPFFTTKEVGKGTGLGLATVYGIVKQNGGFISVESALGRGSAFSIYLPRHAGSAEPARDQPPTAPSLKGRETILLVEDEEANLSLFRRMLEKQGYVVLSAGTPREALHLAREHAGEIHLLLTDVIMPEMNGRDLSASIHSLFPRMKCLFMSGYTADVIAHHGVLDEGVNFIHKPFSAAGLADKIRETLKP
jgi:two-component system, cell cycle sensor histidine kinase and response regulator CckA